MCYAIVEVKKLYQRIVAFRSAKVASPECRETFAERKATMNAKTLLWMCAKNQRHWMNHKMSYSEEYESRLCQTESADVAAGIGVRKT